MKDNTYTVGLVMKSLNADFFKDMQSGAEKWAGEGNRCSLISVGTATQTEIDSQIRLVDDLTSRGVDAIVVVPIDSKALVAPVARAVRAGIKVVNIDIKLDDALLDKEGVKVDFVGPDNLTASHAVATLLASTLQQGAPVAVVEGLAVADNARQRKEGVHRAIREHGLDCRASIPADWETHTARTVFEGILRENPGLKAVFACNDAMALGVIDVLRAAGKQPGEVAVTGFDNDAVMRPLLEAGWLRATVDAYGSQMAVEGLRHALHLLDSGDGATGDRSTPFDVIAGK